MGSFSFSPRKLVRLKKVATRLHVDVNSSEHEGLISHQPSFGEALVVFKPILFVLPRRTYVRPTTSRQSPVRIFLFAPPLATGTIDLGVNWTTDVQRHDVAALGEACQALP